MFSLMGPCYWSGSCSSSATLACCKSALLEGTVTCSTRESSYWLSPHSTVATFPLLPSSCTNPHTFHSVTSVTLNFTHIFRFVVILLLILLLISYGLLRTIGCLCQARDGILPTLLNLSLLFLFHKQTNYVSLHAANAKWSKRNWIAQSSLWSPCDSCGATGGWK